jgi:hypothetical protein
MRFFIVAQTLALLATLATASAASESEDMTILPAKDGNWHVGLSGGATYATMRVPTVRPTSFTAATLGMHAGYNVTERLSVGFELQTAERYMSRDNGFDPFAPAGTSQPQVRCDNCPETPTTGGWLGKVTAVFGTLGPKVEFSPFGKDGLYVGASAGVAFLWGVDNIYGFGGSGRAGYRLRVADILGIALEAGAHAQSFGGGSYTMMPYGALIFRPYF